MGLASQHKKLEKNINLLAIGSFIAVAIGGIVEIARCSGSTTRSRKSRG